MKKNIGVLGLNLFIAATVASSFGLSEASAFGLGVYGGLSSSTADVTVENSNTGIGSTLSKDAGHKSFGLILDSAVAKDKLYNNRFQIGLDQFTLKPGQGASSYDLKGLVISNDFGFGIVRSEYVRFWIGPELRISFLRGETQNSLGVATHDTTLIGWGIGPVLGLNVNMGKAAALGIKGGYLYNGYYGTGSSKNDALYSNVYYWVKEKTPFINIGVIFRMGDD